MSEEQVLVLLKTAEMACGCHLVTAISLANAKADPICGAMAQVHLLCALFVAIVLMITYHMLQRN